MDTFHPSVVFATAVLTIAQINEDSFDPTTGLYGISTEQAAAMVFDKDDPHSLMRPVLTSLVMDWNGIITWAEGVIKAWEPGPLEAAA